MPSSTGGFRIPGGKMQRSKSDHPTKNCTIEGCERPLRAKGRCATHYNQLNPKRHPTKLVPCAFCGQEVMRSSGGGRKYGAACSNECRTNLARRGHIAKRTTSTVLVGPIEPRPTVRAAPAGELPTLNRTFVHGQCVWCGQTFTSEVWGRSIPPLCCSDVCSTRRKWARKGHTSNWIIPRRRFAIYERDGWVCQLCNEPVDKTLHHSDDWAASLDHIVPRSHQLVPDHSNSNLRLAHRWCNAVIGDGKYYSMHDLAA